MTELTGVLFDVSFGWLQSRLLEANGGWLALDDTASLRDSTFDAYERGELSEPEYVRYVRARLGWRGSDPDLVAILSDAFTHVDVGVLEVLTGLRDLGWVLIGVDQAVGWQSSVWRGGVASHIGVFDQIVSKETTGYALNDPRFFQRVLREAPTHYGPRLFIGDDPRTVAAARRGGLDGHVFSGASDLRATCMSLQPTVS